MSDWRRCRERARRRRFSERVERGAVEVRALEGRRWVIVGFEGDDVDVCFRGENGG